MTVAVIGIACRFPGAPGKSELWDVLMSRSAVPAVPATGPDGPFDPAVFGVSAADARRLDARQRLLLSCGWHAAEDAGMDPGALGAATTGIYVGLAEPGRPGGAADEPPEGNAPPGGDAPVEPSGGDQLVERVARHLDLRGPGLAVLGGGPAALVAVHLACSAVLRRECDYALAGGVDPTGAGGGLVMLRRLDDALAEGRSVYAVVRGGAVGGHGRGEPLGPQAWRRRHEVLSTAYQRAGVVPAEVAFAEVTLASPGRGGRPLADAPELRALAAVHDVPRDRPCGVGTVAGGLGEPGGAAGIAAVIKAALALHHRVVPPSAHSDPPPAADLDGTGLRLLDDYQRLPSDREIACGVGGGTRSGTIAHLVLSMVRPLPEGPSPAEAAIRGGVFTLSAPDRAGLARNLRAQAGVLANCRPDELGAICYTSNKVKSSLLHRFVTAVPSLPELLDRLRSAAADPDVLAELSGVRREGLRHGLVLPDLAAWPAGAQIELSAGPAVFHTALDEAATEVFVQGELRDLDLDDDARPPTLVEVMECVDAAVAFCVAYALGRMLMALGPRPAFVAGCGVGAVAAHCLAGTVSLDDAARAVTGRGPLVPSAAASLPVFAVAAPDEPGLGLAASWPDERLLDEATHLVTAGPVDGFARALWQRSGASGPRLLAGADRDGLVDPLELVAELVREGFDLDWDALYPPRQRALHRLAPYEFAPQAGPPD
ncbi:beta-ketoacyl synthase N-terminal-like domain-containing protein [Actinomadura rupiterrae]|uniref:beta-ketoacyl synthase N-terminal-like domain-containing protein n=1 Tax=Actinomadura rupiterrae TaxID=559627 RepID=UPI0020A4D5C9|nr:beta-ketoacyl synthase N-terminal-like domain-containing protein [Actinomadura rupiterrae]MCP2341068.1 acyl transferase domain-containing protein [Actinomadura rupiterrae]